MPSRYPVEVRRQVVELARTGTKVSRLAAPCSSEEKLRRALQAAVDMIRKYMSPDEPSPWVRLRPMP
jgi:hypothetical protein